jgi:hypothetical protein
MYQKAEIKSSLYNYIIIFLIYIINMTKYIISPRKKKYAKIYPILEPKCVYDEVSNCSTDCIIQFDTLTNKPLAHYYVKSYANQPISYYTKSKID